MMETLSYGVIREIPVVQAPPEAEPLDVFHVCRATIPRDVVDAAGVNTSTWGSNTSICSRPPHGDDEVHVSHGNHFALVWGGE